MDRIFNDNDDFTARSVYENDQQFDFIVAPEAVLQALIESKINNSSIGIYSPTLGNTMFITGVDDILFTDEDTAIVLKQYDMSGHILEKSTIALSEIVSVCPFTTPLKNPFLENLEKDTDWLAIINSTDSPTSNQEYL